MLKGFTCPDWGEEPGRNNNIEYCVNHCSMPCVAPPFLKAMMAEEEANPHKGKIISVTMLTGGCKRKTALERTQDYYLVPDKKLPTFRGTLVHSLVERGNKKEMTEKGWIIEKNLLLPVKTKSGRWKLSGTPDYVDTENRVLYDIKTLQEYAVMKLVTGQEKGTWSDHISDSYVKQLNIYRYMGKRLNKFEVDKLKLQIFAFGRLILTGTRVKLRVRNGRYYEEQEFDVPDIPILDDSLIESWIHYEGDEWYNILFNEAKAPVCPEEWKWLCKSCIFNGTADCPDPDFERELS